MRRTGFDGTSHGTDANQAEARSDSPPLAGRSVIPFPTVKPPRSVGIMAGGLSSGPSADHSFESLGEVTRAVLLRLRGDLPRISVWKQDD